MKKWLIIFMILAFVFAFIASTAHFFLKNEMIEIIATYLSYIFSGISGAIIANKFMNKF